MTDVGFGIRPGTSSTSSGSVATAVTSKNPHINPLIFDSPGVFQNRSLGSPTTVCTSPTKYPSPSKKRPAKAIELDSDDVLDLGEEQEVVSVTDDGKPPNIFLSHDRLTNRLSFDVICPIGTAGESVESNTGQPESQSNARDFQVSFNFWQLQVPPAEASNAKKRKKTPGGDRRSKLKPTVPKYENYHPKVPINLTIKNPGSISFPLFKMKVFQTCDQKLPWVSESLSTAWGSKAVDIQGFINSSRKHKAKKMLINDVESLREFMAATQLVPPSTPMGFKVHHENPKVTANASRFMQALVHGRGARGNDPPSEDTEQDPRSEDSVGSDILSPGERKLRILMTRFSKDFKRGENVTSVVNPQDPSLCMLLNTSRIRTWANDWADEVPGVDEVNPPTKRPGFAWIPVANYEKEKNALLGLGPANTPDTPAAPVSSSQGTVVNHNYYGQLFPAPGLGVAQAPLAPPYTHIPPFASPGIPHLHPVPPPAILPPADPNPNPKPPAGDPETMRLSPPPVMPLFEDYLIFAGIKPEMTKTREILAEQGIDTFGRLLDRKTYNMESFRSMGIPFAHADDLTKAIPLFNKKLKCLGSQPAASPS
ncbi:hypothetical protein DFH28DRAFT_1060320 [Melampsora americana]|nr:hypothetical protein DFH28DRAFT_1070860 [Melampsora americana]KAH9811785.1 hypothetical protein DFH28DRAFT_1062732 [Melampsora americana]KAH9813501.1 hypothetical protein DFH28DRAFT_1060320 [Melampsora americana]